MHKLVPGDKCNIMVSAASNVATDNLVAGLLKVGMRVVRIGMPAKVGEPLREVTLDALLMKHPVGANAYLVCWSRYYHRYVAQRPCIMM
jgi:hypothetical protein